jgi:hypothetical protein
MAAPRKNPPEDIVEIIERIVAGEGGSTKILARAIGVSDSLVRAWFDRDQDLKEQYEAAREAHMHKLYLELLQMARTGKGNVAGIIYTLKARFKQYDQPGSGKLVDVNVIQANPVMIVKDHGTVEEWAAKAAAQQRALTADCTSPLQIEAPKPAQVDAVASFAPTDDIPAVYAPWNAPAPLPAPVAPSWVAPVQQPVTMSTAPNYGPQAFNWQSQSVPTQSDAPEPFLSIPVAPCQPPEWRGRA